MLYNIKKSYFILFKTAHIIYITLEYRFENQKNKELARLRCVKKTLGESECDELW